MALTTEPVVSARRTIRARFSPGVRAAESVPVDASVAADAVAHDRAHATSATPRHRGWGRRYASRLLVSDFAALLVASLVIHLFRFPAVSTEDGLIDDASVPYVALTSVVLIIWMLALTWFGSRDPKAIGYGATEYKRIIHATFAVFGGLAIVSFLFKLGLPRSYLLIMMPLGLLAVVATRFAWRRWLRGQRIAGRYLSNVLAVGNIQTVTELLRDLRQAPEAGYRVIGVCVSQPSRVLNSDGEQSLEIDGVPVLGGFR